MDNSILFQLLSNLSASQRIRLGLFLESPYHNQREDVRRLYTFLLPIAGEGARGPAKEQAYEAVFPGVAYDGQQMRYLMSFLLKNAEKFLIAERLRADEGAGQALLLGAYRELRLAKGFQKVSLQVRHQAAGEMAFHRAFAVERERYLFHAGQKRDAPSYLPQLNRVLDEAYWLSRLKQSSLLSAHQAVFQGEAEDPRLLRFLLAYLEGHSVLGENPLIGAYYYYLKTVEKPGEVAYYQLLKECILPAGLPLEERKALFLLAINYGIRQFNTGDESYLPELFELYRTGISEGLLLSEERISRFTFKNITAIGLRLQQFDWVEQFIEQHQAYLPPRFRATYTHYSLSKLRYEQGRYAEAMQRLQQVEYEDIFLNIDAKITLMKIYYELEETEVLDNFLASLERFLNRRKGLGYHRENYRNVIHFTRKLLEANPFGREGLGKLRQAIEQADPLTERSWLLAQLEKI
ncbi:MAG: hypothetical protein KDC66_13355 [Phaeodactylibacter sp.]|nr:hypothetical protein [Phaeodactylibacter sp.]MCB9275208.1 hypothetical protein [Lewinellaceae bacterium]